MNRSLLRSITGSSINLMVGRPHDDTLAGVPESRPDEHIKQGDVLGLLPLAFARPDEALARAREILAGDPDPHDASVARQTIGIVLRDFGDVAAAIGELRAALRLARLAGSTERQSDVQATLGVAMVVSGRTAAGLAALDAAACQADEPLASRVLVRRGIALLIVGRHREALHDLRRAATRLRQADDTIWAARALSARGLVWLSLNDSSRADADLSRAQRLFELTSQHVEHAYAWHNRGLVAFRCGDLPAALSFFDEAAQRYRDLAIPVPDLSIDRCAVLITAGLPHDALLEADRAIRQLDAGRGQSAKRAELLLIAASAALDAGDPQAALGRAQAADSLFLAQRRGWWHAHARFILVRARYAAGRASATLLRQAGECATVLERLESGQAPQARLLAGRVALDLGSARRGDHHLAVAASTRRRRGPPLSRASGWLAEALRADAASSPRRVFVACRRGFEVLDEHSLTLGATELRAQATAQGAELAALAQRWALRAGRPRRLLAWSERWRATVQAVPAVRPVDEPWLRAELTAYRAAASRLDNARSRGDPTAAHQREQIRLERTIRARVMRSPGSGVPHRYDFDPSALLDLLGTARLIEIVDIAGDLHLLVCGAGRVRHLQAGRAAQAADEVRHARSGLSRLAHAAAPGLAEKTLAVLEVTGRRLEALLLGPAVRQLGDGEVIVVPPGSLHAVPWALLPALRMRALSVAPSARAWLRARAVRSPDGGGVVLASGPGLPNGGREVAALARGYGNATLLLDGSATAAGVLGAIDGARLAHIAAHGIFRTDSPLFSSLRMADGPLTVHDFVRLRRAPYRLILPCCESGLLARSGSDELLGLASTLMPMGTAGIVASVVPVNDAATTALMLALHGGLRRGLALSESLRDARRDLSTDQVQVATGLSFLALGAA
jgi:tetratricopeptide (TPR) repeat protein